MGSRWGLVGLGPSVSRNAHLGCRRGTNRCVKRSGDNWFNSFGLHVDSEGALAAPPPAPPTDYVKIAIADHPQGCVLTVLCPLMQLDDVVRPDVMHDALQIGWAQTLQSLAELVAQDTAHSDIAK